MTDRSWQEPNASLFFRIFTCGMYRRSLVRLCLLLCLALSGAGHALAVESPQQKGLTYYGSDPYAALPVARQQGKLLLVEFYAEWNYRSRWMAERVLGNSSVRALIEEHFVAVRVPTDTPDGADLAALYQVTGYPTLVIFSSRGDVLDKIDVTLDADDFTQRIEALLMTLEGKSTWRLRQVYAAAETADPEATDAAVERLLSGMTPAEAAGSVIWPMFENSIVMRYGSVAFDYLMRHVETFRQETGTEAVDNLLTETMYRAMMPYVVGSLPLDSTVAHQIILTARQLELPAVLALESMAEVASLRDADDLTHYVARIGLLINLIPEEYQLQLAMALDIVAERGSHTAKQEAAKTVAHIQTTLRSPANIAILEQLILRLK